MKCIVKDGRVRKGGRLYHPGDEIELADKRAKQLVSRGTLEKPAAKSGGSGDMQKEAESMTVAQLTEALGKMEVEIPDGAKKADLVELYKQNAEGGGE